MLKRLFSSRAPRQPKVAIIGLDCMEPSLLFGPWLDALPTFKRLRDGGLWGSLESVVPAITVPAWSCMMSGQDPGALGIYGFRNRRDHNYTGLRVADGSAVQVPRLWDLLTQQRRRSIVLNVPGTFPARPLEGSLVSCFLTPGAEAAYTFPAALKAEIEADWGAYPFDVTDFRTEDKRAMLASLYAMTEVHFALAEQLVRRETWDLFAMVEIGVDRIHHALWAAMDEQHRHHDPDTPHQNAIFDYYRAIDQKLAALLAALGDDTHIFIVSDHGAKAMQGGICLNEWLIEQGYLVLKTPPAQGPVKFEQLDVNWAKTRAWGEGGYYGRLFLNIAGREPQGVVLPEQADGLLSEIAARLTALGDEQGRPIDTRCFRPAGLYPQVNGIPPDLLIYFGNLAWRSIGTVGWGRVHVFENDTGPDDANHAQHGVFIYHDPQRDRGGRELHNLHLLQIAPTVLTLMGLPVPGAMQRAPIQEVVAAT